MSSKDLYSILGLSRDATEGEIKKAYHKLANMYHPDKQLGKSDSEKKESENKFKEINEAYSILSDSKKKREYDQFGFIDGNIGGGDFSNIADFIRDMGFSAFGGFNPFGGGVHKTEPIVNGEDIRIRIDCTIEDIYNGNPKTVKYTRKVKCSDCNGSGSKNGENDKCPYCNGTGMETVTKRSAFGVQIIQSVCSHCHGSGRLIKNRCHKCNGTGLVETKETVSIPIPIGIRDGVVVSMDGMGHMAPNNMGNPGDLYIKFSVHSDSRFTIVDTNNLKCKLKVNVLDCITGCKKTIDTINGGKTTVNIPVGTKNKQEVVVRNYGMPLNNGKYGDLIVEIEQVMPTYLDNNELAKLNELKNSKNFK